MRQPNSNGRENKTGQQKLPKNMQITSNVFRNRKTKIIQLIQPNNLNPYKLNTYQFEASKFRTEYDLGHLMKKLACSY